MYLAVLVEYPHQMHPQIIRAQILIIHKHIIVVGMVTRRQRTAHILGKCMPAIQIHGSTQIQFVGMAAEDVFDLVLRNKINNPFGIFKGLFIGAQNGMMDQ